MRWVSNTRSRSTTTSRSGGRSRTRRGRRCTSSALRGDWTVGEQITTLNEPGGRISFRFHGRDLNLVMGSRADGGTVRFLILIDGKPPNGARGIDVDERGNGRIVDARLYQLIRQN